jgi:hypothetical protein
MKAADFRSLSPDAQEAIRRKPCAGYSTHPPEKRPIWDSKPRNSYNGVSSRNARALLIPDTFIGRADECPYPNQSLLVYLSAFQNK